MRAISVFALIFVIPATLVAQGSQTRLRVEADEAEASLAILDAVADSGAAPDSLWNRLSVTDGFTRLVAREQSMGRALTIQQMREFLSRDSVVARRADLRRTLEQWRSLPVEDPAARALAYLPAGTTLEATVYPLIKPKTNSFVYDLGNRPAIMLYLDTDQSGAVFANTVAHELHHIGLGAACDRAGEARYADTSAAAAKARNWLGAFGEGLAMLAAAGGPNVHPHRDSPPSERERWDRDSRDAAAQMVALERFFLSILNGRLTADSAITRQGMEFFGVQGPWYTVGYRMWSTVERRLGRARVVADACEPARLIVDYDLAVARDRSAPRWSHSFVRAMRALQAPRS